MEIKTKDWIIVALLVFIGLAYITKADELSTDHSQNTIERNIGS
jgi:hypothetical protein